MHSRKQRLIIRDVHSKLNIQCMYMQAANVSPGRAHQICSDQHLHTEAPNESVSSILQPLPPQLMNQASRGFLPIGNVALSGAKGNEWFSGPKLKQACLTDSFKLVSRPGSEAASRSARPPANTSHQGERYSLQTDCIQITDLRVQSILQVQLSPIRSEV